MSGTLSPDVIAAINKVAATPLGRKYDRMARHRYGKRGVVLAAKEVIGESGGRRKAVSSAGAKGLTQFMPATRADYKRRFGVDAWGSDEEAIKAMMLYQTAGKGVESYNPGMPDYAQYILNQRLSPELRRQLGAQGGSAPTPRMPGSQDLSFTQTTPGQSFAAEREDAKRGLLLGGNLTLSRLLEYKRQLSGMQDVPGTTTKIGASVPQPGLDLGAERAPRQGAAPRGAKGQFKIEGPNPGRLKPELVSYANKVSRVLGEELTGKDGSTHSRLTVNGNVSEHFTGNATDIFFIGGKPATGERLIRAGQAALIAAGMPRAEAMKQRGGLYNVGNHQIIFGVDGKQYGGNHLDHLHISARKR